VVSLLFLFVVLSEEVARKCNGSEEAYRESWIGKSSPLHFMSSLLVYYYFREPGDKYLKL